MKKRTFIEFEYNGDIWPVVNKWAEENKYKLKEEMGGGKIYQKGVGFLVAPMMVKIEQVGSKIKLEAWVRTNFVYRAISLFILPAEMEVISGGFRGVVPRAVARKAVNKLLLSFDQEQID